MTGLKRSEALFERRKGTYIGRLELEMGRQSEIM